MLFNDIDPIETKEWLESLKIVIKKDGINRGIFLISKLLENINNKEKLFNNRNYVNTINVKEEPKYPGDLIIEKKICSAVRWNAIIMVLKASNKNLDLGGHISSFQSSADIYEVCFNHFFLAYNKFDGGDLIFFQGHISPGIYSRAYLEGRLTLKQIDNFRQEVFLSGLPSYPHPKLMPNFWQFPTVSMGLGAVNAIYQAKFLKYLNNRKIKDTSKQTVYAFLGDGEMDEPESKGLLNIASREKLDNLIFVINCNLQRLDGPVYGNGKIINELENIFLGYGWEVIKVIWGSKWDPLFKKDYNKKLVKLMNETLDGNFQTFTSKNGSYIRKNFFNKYKETKKLVENMSDDQIFSLNRGGHDPKKIYAAFKMAKNIKNKPVVILMHTIKGYGMGNIAEGKNIAHQVKKIDIKSLKYIRDKLNIPITDNNLINLPYINFNKNSEEYNYIHKQRKKMYGYIPYRKKFFDEIIKLPSIEDFNSILKKQNKKISTTISFVRILNILLKNKYIKNKIVPIIADEARTFGMEGLFRQIGIYNINGQKYTPQDYEQILCYKENVDGQILQEGINELGACSSWLAAATSYSTNNLPMIPFYIFYSMFGFQRIGDLCWASGDQQARGFLIGGTSGRTTLNGEGLQHEDGHSHIHALTIPNCISYDPTYAYELAVIINDGLNRMYGPKQENIYYYITTLNENYKMPSIPKNVINGICKGIYKIKKIKASNKKIQLLGSGAILIQIKKAAKILYKYYNISIDIYSVTSFNELARDGQDCDRWNLLHPNEKPKIPFITKTMNNAPSVAATDYIKLFAEQVRKYIPSKIYHVLGTDGFGRSDSRKNLRKYFEIDYNYIVVSSLYVLSKDNIIDKSIVIDAIKKFKININKINPRL
ncbi:Pyruvate dehydrogenase E1 component [Candidatus Annandia adelgestsuga]|uniref:Pyruvate dehydrogenase E1 component n=1 Tax=Candidatus Annandia adelgestsuga TaxID=1302411 RepID=A0A3S9J7B9_9ENTR|nr:pyruvate dehydrogenase (acetyl-transferring), homodimeric type [Candidatus Annandia adelgestsuga]AZP36176.1 Pyruvate dehydrogenase E1 component [Candidatus Annandia adelgestsuga]